MRKMLTTALQMLFSSPRNNLEAHVSLIKQTGCRTLLRPCEIPRDVVVDSAIAECNLEVIEIPTLDELFATPKQAFPWKKPFHEQAMKPFMVLHTSGSTGVPKAVNITHGLLATLDAQQCLQTNGHGLNLHEWADQEVFVALPPYHAAGFNLFAFSVFAGTTLIFGPSDKPPSVSTVEQVLDLNLASAGILPPSILEEVAQDVSLLGKIPRWSSVSFGGGPLSQSSGDKLWERTKVHHLLGSTETNNLPELVPESKETWPYHNFHPSLGIKFKQRQGRLHELVFVRKQGWEKTQGVFWTFPNLEEYSMKDLYEEHPQRPGLWAYRGRTDDIIVLSNGEKFNPSEAERIISSDSYIKSAIIVGNGRAQPAVIMEPLESIENQEHHQKRHDSVMNTIQKANLTLPGHAQIHDSHVSILGHSEFFLRSAKGEIRRLPTMQALSSEISRLFDSAETQACRSTLDLNFTNESSLSCSLMAMLSHGAYLGRDLDKDADIFQYGFDSLKVMRLLRNLKLSLEEQNLRPAVGLTPGIIYQNPKPTALASALLGLLGRNTDSGDDKPEDHMQRVLNVFTRRIESISKSVLTHHTIVLTGSTGSLGSYMLAKVLQSKSVEKVICMNRPGGNAHRQAALNVSRGLSDDFSKVQFVETDLTKEHFGLGVEMYTLIVQ